MADNCETPTAVEDPVGGYEWEVYSDNRCRDLRRPTGFADYCIVNPSINLVVKLPFLKSSLRISCW